MGVSWCASLPRVTVKTAAPKPITIIYPYYENPEFFNKQLAMWIWWPEHLLKHVAFIVVDDGSPVHPLETVLLDQAMPHTMRSFRIHEDVRWNWIAARNIAAHEAAEGWLLLTDIDHVIPVETLQACIYGDHRPDTIYGFSRVEYTGETREPHKNSWFLTREMFWKVGGYDEMLSGFYGSDGDWRRRCAKTAAMAILTDQLIRYERLGDSSTTRYLRKQPEDAAIQRIVAERRPGWKPRVLSFDYHEIALCLQS